MDIQQFDSRGVQTILVVDDHEESARSMRHLLEHDGHRVLTARDGWEAQEVIKHQRADLLIIAATLAEGGGRELIRRMRAADASLPVILQHDGLDAWSRRELIRDLELQGLHERGSDAAHFLELVACTLAGVGRMLSAYAAQEIHGLVLAKLCHDLRASLGIIRGYAEILQDDHAHAPTDEILPRLAAANETAIELTEGYLALAQLREGRVLVQREPVDIPALVEDLRRVAERRIAAQPLRIVFRFPRGCARIETDGEKLRAILTELLSNAMKFCPAGEICLEIRQAPERTEFVLTDTGPGIGHRQLQDLFSPFCQSNDQGMTPVPGQGLGLAIAGRLSDLIGASLIAGSSERRGAVFTLTVPAVLCRNVEATLH